jgi:hypothetical protein
MRSTRRITEAWEKPRGLESARWLVWLGPFVIAPILPANSYIVGVEPRGFEPPTSAVQMPAHHFADVRGRSETRLSKPLMF